MLDSATIYKVEWLPTKEKCFCLFTYNEFYAHCLELLSDHRLSKTSEAIAYRFLESQEELLPHYY